MSALYLAWQVIAQLLGSRTLLTFSVTNQFPVCCLFADENTNALLDTLAHFVSNGGNVGRLFVYNPSTQAIESLDTKQGIFLTYLTSVKYGNFLFSAFTSGSPAKFQIFSQPQLVWKTPQGTFAALAFFVAAGSSTGLIFCLSEQGCLQSPSVQVVNYLTLSDITSALNTVRDPVTLCCYTDVPHLIGFVLSLQVPLPDNKSNVYPSLDACQETDTQCNCPTLRTCWMYNDTNVPCCVQGNPSDAIFENNTAKLITKDQNACNAAAKGCSSWSFNTQDVPCCVQRSMNQWSSAGYSTTGLQTFGSKADCQAAANLAGTCSMNSILHPPTNLKDYYGLILESQYTSGCEPLRTAGLWGNSSNVNNGCTQDPSPSACLSGNCDNNYCGPWMATINPYEFSQAVRCLPLAENCCTGSQSQVITDNGKPTVSATCRTSFLKSSVKQHKKWK